MKISYRLILLLLNIRTVFSFTIGIQKHNVNHEARSRSVTAKLSDPEAPFFLPRRTIFRSSVTSENELVSSESLRTYRTKNISQFPQMYRNLFLAFTGILMALALLYSIAMIGENTSVTSLKDVPETFELAYQNTYDAIAPLGISDIISVIVGESTAAVVAATASSFILLCIKVNQMLPELAAKVKTQLVADGDFLVAKAASLSLLSSIGLSPALTKVLSILFASLPYGFFKLGVRRREQIIQEDIIMDELLAEQLNKEGNERIQSGLLQSMVVSNESHTVSSVADVRSLQPVESKREIGLDFVDVFSDIAKWLQYDVFVSRFGDALTWNGEALVPGLEAAIFGAIACGTAQLYCDILYAFFNLGGSGKSEEVCNRSVAELLSLYVSQILYGAALFLTYYEFQIPAQWILNAFLSGGVDNCIGAIDYSGCIETFIELNPPEESPEAELYTRITPIVEEFKKFLISNVERP